MLAIALQPPGTAYLVSIQISSDHFTRLPCYDNRAKITHKIKIGICIVVYHQFSPT